MDVTRRGIRVLSWMKMRTRLYLAQDGKIDQLLGVLEFAIVVDAGLGQEEARLITADDNARGDLQGGVLLMDTHFDVC